MTRTLLTLLAGAVGGWWMAYKTGKAVARAQRAWADYRSTIKSVRGLWARTIEMWSKAARYVAVAASAAVALIALLYVAVTR